MATRAKCAHLIVMRVIRRKNLSQVRLHFIIGIRLDSQARRRDSNPCGTAILAVAQARFDVGATLLLERAGRGELNSQSGPTFRVQRLQISDAQVRILPPQPSTPVSVGHVQRKTGRRDEWRTLRSAREWPSRSQGAAFGPHFFISAPSSGRTSLAILRPALSSGVAA
jgi:hypothetical protein